MVKAFKTLVKVNLLPGSDSAAGFMTTLAMWVKVNAILGKVKGQRPKLAVKILDPGHGRKNRVYGSDTPLLNIACVCILYLFCVLNQTLSASCYNTCSP